MIKTALAILILSMPTLASAEGTFGLGFNGDAWTANTSAPVQGYEFLNPISLSYQFDPNFSLYAQTQYSSGSYTSSTLAASQTITLGNVTDTVAGGSVKFKSFGLNSVLNVAFNIPTGDTSWEEQQLAANVPTEFVDSRYRGRGFGVSGLYGLSLPETKGEYGVAAGYLYSQAFNPSYGLGSSSTTNLKLGDAAFLALNHVQPDSKELNEVAQISVYYSLPTSLNGQNIFQLGMDFNASYAWQSTKDFSLEVGGSAYLPSQRIDPTSQVYGTESGNSFAPRFYLTSSYILGDFTLGVRGKFIFQNNYTTADTSYDGGGVMGGAEIDYHMHFTDGTGFKIALSFDDVDAFNYGLIDAAGDRGNVNFTLWNLGTTYEIKL